MGVFARIIGVVGTFFQVGGPTSPGINVNGSALETRNSANSAYAVHRGATPVGDNDLTTKAYIDKLANKPIPVSLQFNGNNSLPSNSSTEQWYVITTTGVNGTIGQLLWDDGSNAGTVSVIVSATGNTIITTANFSGGTISLTINQLYIWNSSAWNNISPSSIAGGISSIRFTLGTSTVSSATSIPANAIIFKALLDITTPYSGGATIALGITGTTTLFMSTTDNSATTANIYIVEQDTSVGGSNAAVLATIAGSPAAGAAQVVIFYSSPNS